MAIGKNVFLSKENWKLLKKIKDEFELKNFNEAFDILKSRVLEEEVEA